MPQLLRPEAGIVIRAQHQTVVHRAGCIGDGRQVGGRQSQDAQDGVVPVRVGDGVQVEQGAVAVVAPSAGAMRVSKRP